MVIKDWSGGLLLRPYPSDTIQLYGIKYTDIDHQRGSLIPIRTPEPLDYSNTKDYCNSQVVQGTEQVYNSINTEKVTATLGWEKMPKDNKASCNYMRPRAYVYTMYNPTTDEETPPSRHVFGVSHQATDITLYPKVDSYLYSKGFTNIKIYRRTSYLPAEYQETEDRNKAGKVRYRLVSNTTVANTPFVEVRDTVAGEGTDIIDVPNARPYSERVFKSLRPASIQYGWKTWWIKGSNEYAVVAVRHGDNCHIEEDIAYGVKNNGAVGSYYPCFVRLGLDYNPDGVTLYANYCGEFVELNDLPAGATVTTTGDFDDKSNKMPVPCDKNVDVVVTVQGLTKVKGSYTTPTCDDLIGTTDSSSVFTYSNIVEDFIFHSIDGYVVDFKGSTYIFDGDKAVKIDVNRGAIGTIGLDRPSVTKLSGSGGTDARYRFTFYNSITDVESPATDSYGIKLVNGMITAKFKINNANNILADVIRVYRINKGLTYYTLEKVVPISDANNIEVGVSEEYFTFIAGNQLLLDVGDTAPLPNLKYATATNSIIVGAIDDKMYFCEEGNPDVWKRENYLDFDTDITGIGAIRSGIVVFTLTDTYLVVGNNPSTFTKYLITKEVGCIHHRTIQPYNGGLLFASFDGIYFTDGGNTINFTDKRVSKMHLVPSNIINATVANNRYHLALKDDDIFKIDQYYEPENRGIIFVLDYRFNKMFRVVNQDVQWVGAKDRRIVFEQPTKQLFYLYPYDTPYKELHYKSGFLDSGQFTNLKHYNDVYIAYEPPMHLKLTIRSPKVSEPDRVIYDKQLPDDLRHYNLSTKAHTDGYAIQIECIGKGKVHEIALKPKARGK